MGAAEWARRQMGARRIGARRLGARSYFFLVNCFVPVVDNSVPPIQSRRFKAWTSSWKKNKEHHVWARTVGRARLGAARLGAARLGARCKKNKPH